MTRDVEDSCDFFYGDTWGWFLMVTFRGEVTSIHLAEGIPVTARGKEFLEQGLQNWFVAERFRV